VVSSIILSIYYFYSGAEQVNIDEIPHISLADQPQKWPLYLRGDSSEVTATTSNNPSLLLEDYDSDDSFDNSDDYEESPEEMKENNKLVVEKYSRSISDSKINISNNNSTITQVAFGSVQDIASAPRSATVSMPLPKLPFESVDSNAPDKNLNKQKLFQNMPSSNTVTQVSQQVKQGPKAPPCPIKNPWTLSPSPEVNTHGKSVSIIKQISETEGFEAPDDTYDEINPADENYIEPLLSPNSADSKTGRDIIAKEESKIVSRSQKYSCGNVVETVATIQKQKDCPAASTSLIYSKENVPNLPPQVTKYKLATHYYEDVEFKAEDNSKVSSPPHVTVEPKMHRKSADEEIKPSSVSVISKLKSKVSATGLIYDDTISSTDSPSKASHENVVASLDGANGGITTQPIYGNTPASRKSEYVKMYRVKPLRPDDDQASDSGSEVHAYDYVYHLGLKLRRHGKDFDGVPPRNIRRPAYTESPHYVNLDTQPDYVNFKTEKCSTVLPPRAGSTYRSTVMKSASKPIPKQRANVAPAVPARNIPRQGYYLSGAPAIPSNINTV